VIQKFRERLQSKAEIFMRKSGQALQKLPPFIEILQNQNVSSGRRLRLPVF